MPRDPLGRIEGTFTRLGTDEPIPGVHATIRNATFTATTTSDERGYFAFHDLVPGPYLLLTHRNGHLPAPGSAIRVTPEQPVHVLNLSLSPAATLHGRIVDNNGRPVSERVVEFLGRTWQTRAVSPTDKNGEYRYDTLPEGEYRIRLSAMPVSDTPTSVEEATVAYFPGTIDATNATPIHAAAGTETIADFAVPAVKTFKISGKAINTIPYMDRLPALAFSLVPHNDSSHVESEPSPLAMLALPAGNTGDFELRGARHGYYDLFVMAHTPESDYLSKVSLEVHDRDLLDVAIELRRGVDVKGRLLVEGNAPGLRLAPGPLATMPHTTEQCGIFVSSHSNQPGEISLELRRADRFHSGRCELGPLVDEEGTSFNFPNVPEGTYSIAARGRPLMPFGSDTYLADIRVRGLSVFDEGTFDVVTEPVDSIEIVVGTNAGSVQGTVANKGNQKVQLIVIPQSSRRKNRSHWLLITLTEVNKGAFTLRGMAPGNYKLLAIAGVGRDVPFRSADFLAKHESSATSVTIERGVRVAGVQVPLVRH